MLEDIESEWSRVLRADVQFVPWGGRWRVLIDGVAYAEAPNIAGLESELEILERHEDFLRDRDV